MFLARVAHLRVFCSKGERTDVSFRSVDLQISAEERKGSKVRVLEAQRA